MDLIKSLRSIELARLRIYDGNFDEADKVLASVRASTDIYALPKVAAELRLASGIRNLQAGYWSASIDDFRRSEVMARLSACAETAGFALCWQSHYLFNVGRVVEAAEILHRLSRAVVENARPESRHRFCQVVAQLLYYGGDPDRGKEWFDAARAIAGRIHSRGLFSATLFNYVAMFVWNSLVARRRIPSESPLSAIACSEFFDAARNYDQMTGVQNKDFLHSLLRAQILNSTGRVSDALALLTDLTQIRPQLSSMECSKIDLERAWSLSLVDGLSRREEISELLGRSFQHLVDDDELSLAHHLMARLAADSGDTSEEARHLDLCLHYETLLSERRERVLGIMNCLDIPGLDSVSRW